MDGNRILRFFMSYFYSEKENAFFPIELKEIYMISKSWPNDAIAISDDIFKKYSGSPPAGKIRKADNKGLPYWENIPKLTKDEYKAIAETEKASRISEVNNITQAWQTQLMLGIINDSDKAKLIEWMQYIQHVQAIDTNIAPDINWPVKPT